MSGLLSKTSLHHTTQEGARVGPSAHSQSMPKWPDFLPLSPTSRRFYRLPTASQAGDPWATLLQVIRATVENQNKTPDVPCGKKIKITKT